ncbi:trigger factor [Bacteroidia bacterium]|nr:trigger factor [Bacteroidia bacterium]
MNIELKNIDAVNATLTVQVAKEDYQEKVEKTLRDYRKKANIPGFRPGQVPLGLLKKMYGKSVLAEEVNKLLSDKLYNYIKDNNLPVLGEPLPIDNQEVYNFDEDSDYVFTFDLGLAPDFKIDFTKKDKIKYYQITPDEKMIENQVKSYTGRFGTYLQEEVAEENDMLKGKAVESDAKGKAVEGGLSLENAVLTPAYVKDKKVQAKLIGAKKGDTITFDPQKAFDKNEAEIASFLKIKKEQVAEFTSSVTFTIDGITRYKEAERNQELFDKVFGEGVVTSEDEFLAKIKASLIETLSTDSEYKFGIDVKDAVLKKLKDVELPEAFLKRWLLASSKELTEEKLDAEFAQTLDGLKFQLAKDKIAKDKDLKVEAEDVNNYAKKVAKAQFAQYGMLSIPDDLLENYAQDILKNKDSVANIYEKAIEEKVFAALKESVTLDTKEVSIDEFNKLFE